MAWVPQLGERPVGRLAVPLPDVREFGALQGPFVLKDAPPHGTPHGAPHGAPPHGAPPHGAPPPTLHMEIQWLAAGDWHPSRFHPAGAAWLDAAAPPPGPGAPGEAQWLGTGSYHPPLSPARMQAPTDVRPELPPLSRLLPGAHDSAVRDAMLSPHPDP